MPRGKAEGPGCALVTGSARGIGAAIVRALAAQGRNVVINYTSEGSKQAAEELAAAVQDEHGVQARAVQADVSSYDQAGALVQAATEAFGHIDVLVNNAGITRDTLLMRMSETQFDEVVGVDLKGVFNVCQHVAGPMAKQRSGRIINISSLSGILGQAGQANYSAAKAGVIGFTKAVARELAGRGITVNAVAPGFIETDMTANMNQKVLDDMKGQIPLKRIGAPEDIADAVAFLASEHASYITGQVLQVDGGLGI